MWGGQAGLEFCCVVWSIWAYDLEWMCGCKGSINLERFFEPSQEGEDMNASERRARERQKVWGNGNGPKRRRPIRRPPRPPEWKDTQTAAGRTTVVSMIT